MARKITLIVRLVLVFSLCSIMGDVLPDASAESLRSTFTVTNTNNSGSGSLYQAIINANSSAGFDIIQFEIPFEDPGYNLGTDSFVISVTSALHDLSDPDGVWIDGNTQITFGEDDRPNIEITAKDWATAPHVIMIPYGSNNNILQGLTLSSSDGDVLKIDGASNWVNSCVIWGSKSGTGISIMVDSNDNNVTDSFIYGNNLDGINIESSDGNHILRNKIGIEPDYITTDAPNGRDGISVLGSNENEISENIINDNLGDGIQCTLCEDNEITDNFIGGNLGSGLYCSACTNNLIQGNIIGLSNFDYSAYGNSNYGIRMENSSASNDIFGNFVSGNAWDGIHLNHDSTSGNHIESNVIGFGYYGGFVPNGQHGIGIYGANSNYLGKRDDSSRGNYIGGNGWSGVAIVDSTSGNNRLYFNYILNNQFYGVHINNSHSQFIEGNTIHNNGWDITHAGVRIEGSVSVGNMLTMNSITNNTGLGIELVDGGNNMLEAPHISAADCHTVSGTACPGCVIEIYSDDAYEGEFYEGQTYADGSGNFTYSNPGVCFNGPNITAIAIDDWDTSPFSLPMVGVCMHFYLPMIMK